MADEVKKEKVMITVTKKMVKKIQELKPDHLTRSIYIEDCFWKHLEENSRPT